MKITFVQEAQLEFLDAISYYELVPLISDYLTSDFSFLTSE
jgi:hypothetical protein